MSPLRPDSIRQFVSPAFRLALGIALVAAPEVRADYSAFRDPGTLQFSSNTNGASGSHPQGSLVEGISGVADGAASPSIPGEAFAPRSVNAFRLNGTPIRVDGKLDDAPWSSAPSAADFCMHEPDRGKRPSESTVFKVAYDSEALYVGIACHERDPQNIVKNLNRRDQIANSDLVSVYFDPYLDRTTGYNFRVSPAGVQQDAYLFNDGADENRDEDWDAVWEAETTSDEDGWYTEMRIPFSSIRYRPGDSMTWGLQVYRYMHRRGEDIGWATWEKEKSGFVSRFGTLTGLEGVPAPRQLEIVPYVVARTTDPSVEGAEDEFTDFENFGADLKYGITADLTLNAAFQPDFGQVEADPAELNRSPFETFFEEKRPFFIEGSRFFAHPEFTLFYSRRIGTGDENARIRYAGKLTGKAAGDVTLAALVAATDVTAPGQAHNFLKSGSREAQFFVGRAGKDFAEGKFTLNFMQTAALRNSDRQGLLDAGFSSGSADRFSRDGYSSGFDFDWKLHDRKYNVAGTFVGSIVDPAGLSSDPTANHDQVNGTGGSLLFAKSGGTWRGNVYGRWESDRLELNDLGFLSAPDEISANGWLQRRFDTGKGKKRFNSGSINLNLNKSWLYSGREDRDREGNLLWQYAAGHRQFSGGNINASFQFRNYQSAFGGIWYNPEGSDRHINRGGPLFALPERGGFWIGGETDSRKPLVFNTELEWFRDVAGTEQFDLEFSSDWKVSSRMSQSFTIRGNILLDDSQFIETIEQNDIGLGVGGTSYVYGELESKTLDLTLRSNFLFDRKRSLELYFQPFLTVGDYIKAKEFLKPNGYTFAEYTRDNYDVDSFDDSFASVNLNLVYRWEYRPGSTIFLVWTHSRADFETRGDLGPDFDGGLQGEKLFSNEPENSLLAKMTYWFAL